MEKVLYSELIIVCIMVLAIVWHSDVHRSRGPVLIGQKVFRILIWVNIITMIFDAVQVIYDGTKYLYSREIEYISIFGYYVLHCLVGYLFALYVDFELYPDNKRFKQRVPYYSIPILITTGMCVSSIWNGCFFIINENNSYERGSLYFFPTLIALGYVMYSVYMLLVWHKTDNRKQKELFMRLLSIPFIPCIGAILQLFMEGASWTYPATTLAILINHVTVQNSNMSRDHLTGLYNRSQLENFMNYQMKNLKKGKLFFLILLDLDKFKGINDTFGHVVGDEALINAAQILRGSCKRKEDYVARLGGDEFVIIGQCENESTVEMIVKRMDEVADWFNKTEGKPYKILFSAGYTLYDGSRYATLDTLISEADQEMYKIKKAKKMKENNL